MCSDCEVVCGKQMGCIQEIQCLIGCVLCVVFDFEVFGLCIIYIDCDVIQVDGGMCMVSIIGVFVVVYDVVLMLIVVGKFMCLLIIDYVVVILVGVYEGVLVFDFDYVEDLCCDIDMNVVMMGVGGFVEVQGMVEGVLFLCVEMNVLFDFVQGGIVEFVQLQKDVLGVSYV